MASMPTPAPYKEEKVVTGPSKLVQQLAGLTKNSPADSPYKWLASRAADQARQVSAMTTGNPSQEALAYAYGVPSGTDLAPYIQASKTGTLSPMYKPTPSTPTQTAAQGGLMSLRRFATGGAPAAQDLTPAQRQAVAAFNATISGGGKPTAAQIAQINKIEQTTGRNVSPYTNTGTAAVGNTALQNSIAAAAGSGNYPTGTGTSPAASISSTYPNSTAAQNISSNTGGTTQSPTGGAPVHPVSQGLDIQTPYYDPTSKQAQPYGGVTDPNFQKAVDAINNLKAPAQFQQGTDIMNQAAQGLMGAANYSPQQVAAQAAAAQQGSAQQASSQGYSATNMSAPEAARVEGYKAAQADVNQMQQPKDVSTTATKEQQMTGPSAVQTKALQNFQMQGPGSWTDPGVSQKYMDPYKQGVIDIAKRQKDVDYQKQMAGINAQAASAGAFGGARQAMERSQASKDYQQQLQDLETQGMSQAYQSGMGQYGQESGLGQQANIQNLQAMLGVQQTGSAQDLQAALANQGMDYNTAVQNLQARMGTQQFNAQQNLQGQVANQQAGLTTGQANLGAAQQTSLANQAALNQQQQQYVQNALQAEMQRYGGQLTAAQQNAVAQNAASQFTAAAGNTASLTNAQLGTQASLTNAGLGTQASLANAQNALQASMSNQQAGLSANSQNLSAMANAGQMGQGIGALGTSVGNFNLQIPQLYGQAAQGSMGAGQNWANNQYTSGQNWNNFNPFAATNNMLANFGGKATTTTSSAIPGATQ